LTVRINKIVSIYLFSGFYK